MTLDEIKNLIEFIREKDLTEFELEQNGVRVRIRTGGSAAPVPLLPAVSVVTPALAPLPTPAAPPVEPVEDDGPELAIVKSPIVGTFYRSADPGAKPFVDIGDSIKKGQVLCIIEAMKLMNEIDSEYDGEIVNVYVENGQAVQYGERLFAIRLK